MRSDAASPALRQRLKHAAEVFAAGADRPIVVGESVPSAAWVILLQQVVD